MMLELLPARVDTELGENPWGRATDAVDAAFDFFDWWREGESSRDRWDRLSARRSIDRYLMVKDMIEMHLPEDLRTEDNILAIYEVAAMLSLPNDGSQYQEVLNDAILLSEQDSSIIATGPYSTFAKLIKE